MVHYTDYPNALAFGFGDPRAAPEDTLSEMSEVETSGRAGGAIFPLRDGAEVTWTQLWRDDSFEAKYEMKVSVACCQARPENTLTSSAGLWLMDFTYENAGDVGKPHGGRARILYDEGLGVVVSRQTSSWNENATSIALSEERLIGIRLPVE